jgi:hypothetical protein
VVQQGGLIVEVFFQSNAAELGRYLQRRQEVHAVAPLTKT